MLDFALWLQPSWIYFVKNYLKIIPIKYNFKLLVVFEQLSKIRKSNCIIDSGSRVDIWIVINTTYSVEVYQRKFLRFLFFQFFPDVFEKMLYDDGEDDGQKVLTKTYMVLLD
jgi:hypothetical protein